MKKDLLKFLNDDLSKFDEILEFLRDLNPRPSWESEKYKMALDFIEDTTIYWQSVVESELKRQQQTH